MTLRKTLIALLVAVTLGGVTADRAAAQDPAGFVLQLSNDAIQTLGQTNDPAASKQKFRQILNEAFDVPWIGRFVVGHYWRQASPEQQKEYLKVFEDMLVQLYGGRLSDFVREAVTHDKTAKDIVDIQRTIPKGENGAIVVSRINMQGQQEPLDVAWILKNQGGDYKIIDISAGGVSMAKTQREEFYGVLQQNNGNMDALIRAIEQRNNELAAK